MNGSSIGLILVQHIVLSYALGAAWEYQDSWAGWCFWCTLYVENLVVMLIRQREAFIEQRYADRRPMLKDMLSGAERARSRLELSEEMDHPMFLKEMEQKLYEMQRETAVTFLKRYRRQIEKDDTFFEGVG